MFRHKPYVLPIALAVLCVASVCSAAFKKGDSLPSLDSYKLEGKLPESLKGKVVLLDFWASWCEPCKKSFPVMQDLHKKYAEQGLTIIAVSVDEKREDMERFLKNEKVSFTVVRDAEQKLAKAADISAMPTSFLIDRTGKIRYIHQGFAGGNEAMKRYQEEIQSLLKEPAP